METEENSGKVMPLLDHLEELRGTIFRILIAFVLASCVGLFYSEFLLQFFILQGKALKLQFVVIAPAEGFFTQLRIGLMAGFILSMPFNLHFLWSFVGPGLKEAEKKVLVWSIPVFTLLFILGAALAYYVVIPLSLSYLLTFNIASLEAQISIEKHVSFCLTFMLLFGFVFELPLMLTLLNWLGILPISLLQKFRPHIVLGTFIIAALLTPPDVISQICLAVPTLLLYEGTLFVLSRLEKTKKPEDVITDSEAG